MFFGHETNGATTNVKVLDVVRRRDFRRDKVLWANPDGLVILNLPARCATPKYFKALLAELFCRYRIPLRTFESD